VSVFFTFDVLKKIINIGSHLTLCFYCFFYFWHNVRIKSCHKTPSHLVKDMFMTNFRKVLSAVSIAVVSATASAGNMALPNGISLDPKTGGDPAQGEGNYDHGFNFVQWWENAGVPTSLSALNPTNFDQFMLNGYGELEIANDIGKFECAGCEITFDFSDIGLEFALLNDDELDVVFGDTVVEFINANPGAAITRDNVLQYAADIGKIFPGVNPGEYLGAQLDASNASLGIWVDYTPDLSVNATPDSAWVAQASDGFQWLTLDFQEVEFSTKAPGDGVFGLSSADSTFGLLASGGNAFKNVDDAQGIKWAAEGINLLSDVIGFGLSATFNRSDSNDNTSDYEVYSSVGTGNVRGNIVSAPATLGILGLSVIGAGMLARRRKIIAK
jgi:hypothetical protein